MCSRRPRSSSRNRCPPPRRPTTCGRASPVPQPVWPLVLEALRTGALPALSQVASTSMGLWLVRATYIAPRVDPAPLLELGRGSAAELHDHLCDQLIPALVNTRRLPTAWFGPSGRSTPGPRSRSTAGSHTCPGSSHSARRMTWRGGIWPATCPASRSAWGSPPRSGSGSGSPSPWGQGNPWQAYRPACRPRS